jgi:GH25 family lysozyme M1 (1,4-beta-N-acetylmuramidase)
MSPHTIIRGVDVSYYQRTIDFQIMASRGIQRVYMRAAYGLRPDIRFKEYWQASAGVIPQRGVYLYFLASQNPVEQAENLFELVSDASTNNVPMPDQPCVLDVEHNPVDGQANHPGKFKDYQLRLVTCLVRIEELFGQQPLIYTNPSTITQYLKDPDFAQYGLWIANPSEIAPRVPLPWAPGLQRGWQYSFRNRLGPYYGVESMAIDLDLWYE